MSDDITLPALSKSESWELTDEIRQGFETIHENRLAQVDRLARAYQGRAWEGMGYDSFDEYKLEEFGEDLQHQRFELEERINAVKVLSDSGMAKVQIADILGVHRNTVTNLLKRIDDQPAEIAQGCASTEVDAPGQSVEEVGHIEDDEPWLQDDRADERIVINFAPKVEEPINDTENLENSIEDRFAGIDFSGMVMSMPTTQIVEYKPSEDTSDYFVPRVAAPSWSPPQVAELPPPPVSAYHDRSDDGPEFLEPPMKLQKVGEANKAPDEKHCKTCACNLLP